MEAYNGNALTIGTYQPKANEADDHVEIGINCLTQELAIKFLKEAKPVLTGDAKTLWEAISKEISSL